MLSDEGKFVKKQLEQLRFAKKNVKTLQNELKWWLDADNSLRASSFNFRVKGGSQIPYAEFRVIKIDELEQKIDKAIQEALKLEDDFLYNVSKLDAMSQNLLYERYLTGSSLKSIIKNYAYSERQIYRFYEGAFEKLASGRNKK